MKKVIGSIITAILASLALAVPAVGQSQNLFFGEYHNYSVTFKENGEAVVFARLVFTNTTEEEISTYNFKASDYELKELTILQVTLPQVCAEYSQTYGYSTDRSKCLRFRDPDYNSYYYYSYGSNEEITYKSAKFSNEELSYTVALPEPVKPEKTSALLLAYTSTDYTKNNFLAKSFSFPTLTIGDRITEAKIGVYVDEGLVLEGVETPAYCTMGMCPVADTAGAEVSTQAVSSSSGPITNRNLDNLYGSIGYGQKVFQAKSIAPDKSFTVEGKYATSKLRLNSQNLIVSILGVIFLVLVIVLISLKLNSRSSKPQSTNKGKWTGINLIGKMVPIASMLPMAGLISVTWYLASESFSKNIWFTLNGAGKSFVIVFAVLLYTVLVCISPIIYGLKSGWRAALSLIIAQTIWATLLLAITLPIMIFAN